MRFQKFAIVAATYAIPLAIVMASFAAEPEKSLANYVTGKIVSVDTQSMAFTVQDKGTGDTKLSYTQETKFYKEGKPATAEQVLKKDTKVTVIRDGDQAKRVSATLPTPTEQ